MVFPVLADHEKKVYASDHSFFIRAGHIINCISWLLVFLGFVLTYSYNPFYLVLFGFSVFFCVSYLAISNIVGSLYKSFPYAEHVARVGKYWSSRQPASIDIFLPICGEP